VLGLLDRLHRADPGGAEPEERALPGRDQLSAAVDRPWTTGPYAEPCRRLLAGRAADLAAGLADFDALAARVAGLPRVVTHGEPHPGNFVRTAAGLRLVDWDTLRLAPAERDLWLVDGPGDPDGLAYYRLRWRLADIAGYVTGWAYLSGSWFLPRARADDRPSAEAGRPRPSLRAITLYRFRQARYSAGTPGLAELAGRLHDVLVSRWGDLPLTCAPAFAAGGAAPAVDRCDPGAARH
jgi:phosphotransferase family enzyme